MKQKSILCAFPLKKALSVFLSVLMVLSVLPLAVFAEDWKDADAKDAQLSLAQEPQQADEEPVTYTGDLLSVEITVGNERSVYATDEAGRLQLVSKETVQKIGPLRAPAKPAEDAGFDGENIPVANAEAAARWALTHPMNEAIMLRDANGVASMVYGTVGYGAPFTDENHDLICDICGYCIDGCIDGVEKYYSESDIAEGPDAEGKYYNASGTFIGQDAVGSYTYEMVDENDKPILDENGDPVTTTETYEFIQYESYTEGKDGVCDNCGQTLCVVNDDIIGHDFTDGLCDGCGACRGAHADNEIITGADGSCDVCGFSVTHEHTDDDGDENCDVCNLPLTHTHTDVTGATITGNGICDVCGYCTGNCTDADSNGICDVCGKTMLAFCEHSDIIGSDTCAVCGAGECHITSNRLQQLQATLSLLLGILAKNDEDEEHPQSYREWMNETLIPFLTAKTKDNSASETSLGSLVAMRQEMKNALEENRKTAALLESLRTLTADDMTVQALAGYFGVDDNGKRVLISEGTYYGMVDKRKAEYNAGLNGCVFEKSKSYYTASGIISQCYEILDNIAGSIVDDQIEEFYGRVHPWYFEIDEDNYTEIKRKMNVISEELLARLYDDYQADSYKEAANSIWTTLATTDHDDHEWRCIAFAMLTNVREDINKIREAAFNKFTRTEYADEDGVYVTRPAYERDILRDADDPDDTYQVTDGTINALISRIDGFAGSPELLTLLQKLLPDTFEMEIKDADGDGDVTIYDFVMNFLTQKIVTNDLVNELFGMLYPLITDLGNIVEDLLKKNPVKQYIYSSGGHSYGFDLFGYLTGSMAASEAIDLLVGASATFYVNGGKAPEFKKLFRDSGYSFWPSDIAKLVTKVNANGKYDEIIAALNGCSDNWETLMTDGKLTFDWKMEDLADLKDVISVLLGSIAPLTEMLFATEIRQNSKTIVLNKLVYLTAYAHLSIISFPARGNVSLKLNAVPMHLYDDVLVPIFEALGVNSFTPSDGSSVPTHNCAGIYFDKNKSAVENSGMVVDALIAPLTVFMQQLASHPIEKLLSILPNLSIMLDNGKLFELFDFDYSLDVRLTADFPIGGWYFDEVWDIVEDNIMKHWYDYLNPVKWAQVATTAALYWAVNLAMDAAFGGDLLGMAEDFGITGALNDVVPSLKGLPLLPNLLNSLASLLGGHLSPDGDYKVPDSVKLKIKLGDIITDKKINIYNLLEDAYLDAEALRAIGFDLNSLSDILEWFFTNLKDENGDPIYLFDPAYLNIKEISTLGELQIKRGSVRSENYAKRWNALEKGDYYFVNGDTADVFYYFLRLINEGILKDEEAFDHLLGVFGLNKEKLGQILSNLGDKGADVIGVTLSDLVTNACDENGKLSIDRLLSNLTTDNLLLVLCELLEPSDSYELESITYPETPAETKSEIDGNDGVIPYLEYDNFWTKNKAEFVANDIDDVVDILLKEIPIDLDPDKEGIETIRAFAKPFILELLNQPDYLTTIVELLTCFYSDGLALPADLIHDATGIDISAWYNDFGYLFDAEIPAPTEKVFPDLSGSTGADGKIIWTYNGNPVETYSDIFAALGYVLSQADPILNMVLCGEDFNVMTYTRSGQPTGSVLTIKGNDGYNFTLIPLLEAMGISDVMTSDEFAAMGTTQGLLFCVNQIVDRLFDIFDSETVLADLLEMLAQLGYAIGENGLGVILKNSLHPIFVLIDTLRPVLDIDINALLNALICRFTYKIGGFESADEMLTVLRDERHADIRLHTLSVDALLDLIGVVLSAKDLNGERKYLDLKTAFHEGMRDLAYLRDTYTSKAYALDDNGNQIARDGYYLNLDGPDALTSLVSMALEMLMTENNADALDALIGNFLRKDGSKYHHGIVKTALELLNGIPATYTSDYDWAYILGDDATADEKTALIETIKQNGSIAADDYRTAQASEDFNKYLAAYELTPTDERSAAYLAAKLDAMIESALSIETDGSTLGVMLLGRLGVETDKQTLTVGEFVSALLHGLLNDQALDGIMGTIGKLINGLTDDLAKELAALLNKDDPASSEQMINDLGDLINQYKEAIFKAARYLDLDIEKYNIDSSKTVYADGMVTYYDFNGAPTGLTRHALAQDLANFGEVASELLMPIMPILSFLLLGRNLALFNTDGVPASRERRDDLINVTGIESYRYVLLPLLDALGCKNLKPADQYDKDDYNDVAALVRDMFGSLANRINELAAGGDDGKVIDGVLALLPELLYFFNSNAAGISMANFAAPIDAILGYFNTYSGRTGDDAITVSGIIRNITGKELDVYHLSLIEMLCLILPLSTTPTENALCLNEFLVRLLENFTIGKIYYKEDSPCDFDMFGMTYRDDTDKAKMITILISLVLDALEDPDNEAFLDKTLGKPIAGTLRNIFRLEDFKFDYQDPTWLFTEYADTDHLVSALTLSKLFNLDPYAGKLWTREMAAELADNLDQFVEDMLYLLGLEINGLHIKNLRELMHALIGGSLFTDDVLNALAGMLGQIKPLLDKYDPNGAIAGFIKELIDVDLHAWDDYAKGGRYENGRDWGFSENATEAAVDANGAVFEAGLVELLSPAAPVLAWLLADSDFTLFAEGDGLGENAEPIQLTFPGAEGYKYALVPLFEALNIDGSPKNLVQNLRDGDICDPAVYTANVKEDVSFAVTGVVHPLVAFIQKLMDSTATQILELLPSLVYFINSNGIDTVVKNLIHAVLIIANAAEPMKEQISALVYDEQGIDLYKTLNMEKLVKDSVYGAIGVTENDVKDIYEQCGGVWKTVDGIEDVDFRLLFSVGLAAVNHLLAESGVPLKFTSIAALAVNELTHGFVRSYDSWTGKTAYTMIMDKTIDRYCYGDLLSILMRILLKFLSADNNVDALVALIKTKANIGGVGEAAICAFLHLLAGYMGSLGSFEVAMLSIYYTVYGASRASGSGVEAYDHVNDKLGQVVDHLKGLDNDIARAVLKVLIAEGDEQIGDIVGSQGVAGNGLIRFFKQIADWFMRIINFFKGLFRR